MSQLSPIRYSKLNVVGSKLSVNAKPEPVVVEKYMTASKAFSIINRLLTFPSKKVFKSSALLIVSFLVVLS